MSIDQDLQEFQQKLQSSMSNLEQRIYKEMQTMEKNCLDNSKGTVDNYVNCMMKQTKKIEKQQKQFEFKISFMQNQLFQCLDSNQSNKEERTKCQDVQIKNVNQYLSDLLHHIRN